MNKHTPGPWYGPHFASDDCSCNCGYIFSDSQAGMGAICNVYFERNPGDENEPIEIAKANATLIAAAPDLLYALEAVIDYASSHCDSGPYGEGWQSEAQESAIALAHAAIAKARGES